MVKLSEQQLVTSLRELDPGERALLNLSLRHRLVDEELGGLMGLPPGEIESRRREALQTIADRAGPDDGPPIDQVEAALSAMSTEGWKKATAAFARPAADVRSGRRSARVPAAAGAAGDGDRSGVERERSASAAARAHRPDAPAPARPATARPVREPPAAAAGPGRAVPGTATRPDPEVAAAAGMAPPSTDDRRRRRRALVALALLVAMMAIAAIAVALTRSSNGPQPAPRSPAPVAAPAPGAPPAPRAPARPPHMAPAPAAAAPVTGSRVALEPVIPTQHGHGTARLLGSGPGSRIRLSVAGLPRPAGRYAVWLFNTVADSVQIGTFDRGRAELTLKAGPRLSRYRFLDVSLQPPGSTAHSGQSVLRVRTSRLRGAGSGS